MSNSDYKSIYERACAYPFVTPDMYARSTMISVSMGSIETVRGNVLIQKSHLGNQLLNSDLLLPGYDIKFGNGSTLERRLAVIAIGSNSSPDVMIKKFRANAVGGDFFMVQATMPHHAVVHGAFIGAAGTVPATIVPHRESETQITVSFLSMEQAEKLTGTEPNYDLVQTNIPIETRGLANNPIIPPGALGYVSPWRSLSKDGVNPLALDAIPSTTPLEKMTSEQVTVAVTRLLDKSGKSPEEFFNSLDLSLDARLIHSYSLQPGSIPARFDGRQVRQASVSKEAEKRGLPAPAIQYIR